MRRSWLRRQFGAIGFSVFALCSAHAHAQLTWGTGGNGGSGTWDPGTTADWWNGTSNVTWSANSDAIFAGTGGTVTSVFPGPVANSLTFNSPGYTIQSGWITSNAANFNIVTNAPATISSTLSSNISNGTLVKSGAGTLTVAGTNFFDNVQINQGEYLVGGNSSLFFSKVTLADSPGVVVTLGQTTTSISIQSLSGGGSSGGIVQPNSAARTVTLTLWDTGTFGGVMQDNGSGKLALDLFALSKTATFTNANTYTGSTTVENGTLALSQNGSILNSAITIYSGGTLQLDNSRGAVNDRISDTLDLTMKGGQINFIGNGAGGEEVAGNLKFSSAVSIYNTGPAGIPTMLTFSGVTRMNHATINLTGSGGTKWVGMANDAYGILGAYVTAGPDWATIGGDGSVAPLPSLKYATNINTAGPSDHVKVVGGGTTTLAASGQRATLSLANNSGSTGILDIGAGQTLTLADGGILSAGITNATATQIQNGTLRAGATGELVVINQNPFTISSNIGESVAGTGLTKSGTGTLTLSGTNTYSGITAINQGTLVVSSDANLGTASTIEFNGGTLKAGQSFSSSKGFTRAGTIDTAGFDLTFSGTNTAGISKIGAGTLTLTNPAAGTVGVSQGSLILPSATSGNATLQGGNLIAAGTLSSLSLFNNSTMDIGGTAAANLTTQQFSVPGGLNSTLTIRFGLGISASDLWAITTPVFFGNLANNTFLFDFQNLGGVTAGQDYPLMNTQSGSFLNSSMFALAPSALSAGWNGTFNVTPTTVSVHLTATPAPEPSSALLFALGVSGLCSRRRRP